MPATTYRFTYVAAEGKAPYGHYKDTQHKEDVDDNHFAIFGMGNGTLLVS